MILWVTNQHGVNKSKPKTIPSLFAKRIDETIKQAKKTVEAARERIRESKIAVETARQTLDESKHKKRA